MTASMRIHSMKTAVSWWSVIRDFQMIERETCKLCGEKGSEQYPLLKRCGNKWHKKCYRKMHKVALKILRPGGHKI